MTFLNSFPITKRLMTPDEVLSVLQHRLTFIAAQRRMPAPQLLRSHSVYELLCFQIDKWTPLVGQFSGEFWSDVADSFNDQFILDLEDHQWLSVLRRKYATVGDLCDFIARHAEREVIPEIRLTSNSCKSAGLFLALRERVQRMSRLPLDINPSTCLPDRRIDVIKLDDALAVLSSEHASLPQYSRPLHITHRINWSAALFVTMLGTMVALVIAAILTENNWLKWPAIASFGGCIGFFLVGFYYTAKYDRWHWPEMKTYRDLVWLLSR